MIIDSHVHISDREGCIEELLAAMDKNGIDMAVVFDSDNDHCRRACDAHADRLIPFGHVRLGQDPYGTVTDLADQGFKGLKLIRPAYNYHDERLLPYYELAERAGLVCLFHTGIIARGSPDEPSTDDTSRMKVIWLDTICRRFPKLTVIAAHMGNPDHEEGAMMARWHPNFYYDLSGSSLLHRSHQFFRELFWWDKETRFTKRSGWRPFEKMLFATDEPYDQLHEPLAEQRALLEALDQDEEMIAKVFGLTAAGLLGIEV